MLGGRSISGALARLLPAVALIAGMSAVPTFGADLDPEQFPVPANLRSNVRFWSDIYSRYNHDQLVFHDERHLQVVYRVIELSDLNDLELTEGTLRRARLQRAEETREEIEAALRSLGGPESKWTATARRYRELWNALPEGSEDLLTASRNVRFQNGLSDRFAEAIVRSGRYMERIERALAARDVPTVLSRLPFVESMFVNAARSKVGASGAWQFMLGTARLYLPMSSAVDSRVDPVIAADGAARMLRHDYDALGSWPLAITAYNYGRAGVARAAKQVGSSDLGLIVDRYRGRRFGFASRNFYSEFIAASQVYEQRESLFPGVEPAPALEFDVFVPARYVSLTDLSSLARLETEELRELNPALDSDVFAGTLLVPRGYPLRVPMGTRSSVSSAYSSIPDSRKKTSQLQTGYRVRSGDTLGVIARRYGTSVGEIQRANRLPRADRIYVNQYLRIPGQSSVAFGSPLHAAAAGSSIHTVARGETLASIAGRYGLTVADLVTTNSVSSPDRIAVGQQLKIPRSGGESTAAVATLPRQHVVRGGENLTLIADRYGVTVGALQRQNRLESSRIFPGQILRLP